MQKTKLLTTCIRRKSIEPCSKSFKSVTWKIIRVKNKRTENSSIRQEINDSVTKSHGSIEKVIANDSKSSQVTVQNIAPEIDDVHANLKVPYSKSENAINLAETCDDLHKTEQKDSDSDGPRFNELNLQMISRNVHKQLFGSENGNLPLSTKEIDSIKKTLLNFGIDTKNSSPVPDVNIDLPPLKGQNIEEHFRIIADSQVAPYLKIINNMIKDIPPIPDKFVFREGWTRYSGSVIEAVEYPKEEGIIFDVEVCMKEGPMPTMATAVSPTSWYGWVSKSLIEGSLNVGQNKLFTPEFLIPLESSKTQEGTKLTEYQHKPKIVVGHNVSFDRIRIKEQYWLNNTGTRFLDTMSMHVSVSGINSYQRAILKSKKSNSSNEEWSTITSLSNLADVYKLYCNAELDKQQRDIFVTEDLTEIRNQFNSLMTYCASDVAATHQILKNLFPLFKKRFPHPVTLAGTLELGSAYLPININWERYLDNSDSTYRDLNSEAKICLSRRADQVCRLIHNDKYKNDLWMWNEDWSTQNIKIKAKLPKLTLAKIEEEFNHSKDKELLYVLETPNIPQMYKGSSEEGNILKSKFKYLEKTKYFLQSRLPFMPGYPAWYRKLCLKEMSEEWTSGPQNISTGMQIVPKILNLTWENYPLYYIREHGWGFLVPYSNEPNVDTDLPIQKLIDHCADNKYKSTSSNVDMTILNLSSVVEKDLHKTEFWRYKNNDGSDLKSSYNGSGVWCNVDIDNCCHFLKLPHKDGASNNVGNPLSKDFSTKFSENVLAGLSGGASEVLKISKMTSYWRNNRDRIYSQLAIWIKGKHYNSKARNSKSGMIGAIIPQVVVSGTLTRRATESTWMTASNAHEERVGSELRAMIQAPPNFSIVGADVDSQELWIAAIIGDSYNEKSKIQGMTPFGWMTLIGNKADGTDMHSVTAKAVGISRDHAKIINYARIYGAGQKFAERLLKQFNPTMSSNEATSKARKMFTLTKGRKVYRLLDDFKEDLEDKQYTSYEAYRICKLHGKHIDEMFDGGSWIGGTESAMFNRLEEIAKMDNPITPFLNAQLSRALENKNDGKYLPTKVNWVVQSGAVDFLHLMLVCMRSLMQDKARFCLSFHDEIRYLVPSKYKYNAALAMHITNLMVRSFCASRLGMKDLPMSVAFFSGVEVDTVLRKNATHNCKTPSNPHGMELGYGVSPGESLDIWSTVEKCGGILNAWNVKNTSNKEKSKDCQELHSTNTTTVVHKDTK